MPLGGLVNPPCLVGFLETRHGLFLLKDKAVNLSRPSIDN